MNKQVKSRRVNAINGLFERLGKEYSKSISNSLGWTSTHLAERRNQIYVSKEKKV